MQTESEYEQERETVERLAAFLRWLVEEGYAAQRMLPYGSSAWDIAQEYVDKLVDAEATASGAR